MASRQPDEPERLFSSKRERRLWIWALIVVVAIWSTLGLARTLAGLLGGTPVGSVLFVVACLIVLAVVVTQGLTTRPTVAELAVAVGVATAYLLVFVRMSIPTERSHLVEYGVVAICVYEALLERASQGRRVPVPAVLAVLVTSLLGSIDECIQAVLPSRVFDPVDILFNVLAGVMAVATSAALRWARRWKG
jgi:hypothetical protein